MLLVALTFREVAEAPDLQIRLEWLKLMILTVPIVGANFFIIKRPDSARRLERVRSTESCLKKNAFHIETGRKSFLKKMSCFYHFSFTYYSINIKQT